MSFWKSPTGKAITGNERDSFLQDFSVIPDGTMALASIKMCMIIEADATQYKEAERYIEVIYKLIDGEFKNREVKQKIKVFAGKPESIHRNLNMLKLLMTLCEFKPTHNEEPTESELGSLCDKIVGIKIGEWSIPTQDGGIIDGNNVREVHPSNNFECETGIKKEPAQSSPTKSHVDSAFSRNAKDGFKDLNDDIPF